MSEVPEYVYETAPRAHQREWFERTRAELRHADYSEMGTGKTKVLIDTMAWLFERGRIRGVLVLAPASVAPNWTTIEVPKHAPERIHVRSFLYLSSRAGTKRFQAELAAFLNDPAGLALLAMSYSAMMTDAGKEAAWALLRSRPCLYALDECQAIKTPKTRTSKRIIKSGRYAPYRRVMTGTPIADKPFDAYAPIRFLDRTFWHSLGVQTFAGFKGLFGVFKMIEKNDGSTFNKLLAYRNLDALRDALKRIGHRVLKKDVLDLPPKSYTTRFFELPPEGRRRYDAVEDGVVEFLEAFGEDSAGSIEGNVTQLRRAACGIYPSEDPDAMTATRLARLELCREVVDDALEASPEQGVIVWADWPADIAAICMSLEADGITTARIDGTVPQADRMARVNAFQEGRARVFAGNPAVAGSGLTLTRATTVVFYSTGYALSVRLQAEDRAHRDGQTHPVLYVDLCAMDTVDEKVLDTLVKKDAVARTITAEGLREWIKQRRKKRDSKAILAAARDMITAAFAAPAYEEKDEGPDEDDF